MSFAPIAIVGQGCVLPEALSPDELWHLVRQAQVVIGPAPAGRWDIDPALVLATNTKDTRDRTLHDRGGYVQGFDKVFDPHGFAVSAEQIAPLDPLFHWVLHAGREALREVHFRGDKARAGVVIGNLCYPSSSLSRYAERFWLEQLLGGSGGKQASSAWTCRRSTRATASCRACPRTLPPRPWAWWHRVPRSMPRALPRSTPSSWPAILFTTATRI